MLGFIGLFCKEEAEEIKRELSTFLYDTLRLGLSEEKMLLMHARTGAAKVLGYRIVSQHVDGKLDYQGQRQVNEASLVSYFIRGGGRKSTPRNGSMSFHSGPGWSDWRRWAKDAKPMKGFYYV